MPPPPWTPQTVRTCGNRLVPSGTIKKVLVRGGGGGGQGSRRAPDITLPLF